MMCHIIIRCAEEHLSHAEKKMAEWEGRVRAVPMRRVGRYQEYRTAAGAAAWCDVDSGELHETMPSAVATCVQLQQQQGAASGQQRRQQQQQPFTQQQQPAAANTPARRHAAPCVPAAGALAPIEQLDAERAC